MLPSNESSPKQKTNIFVKVYLQYLSLSKQGSLADHPLAKLPLSGISTPLILRTALWHPHENQQHRNIPGNILLQKLTTFHAPLLRYSGGNWCFDHSH